MILSLVALLTPAYATNEVTVSLNPISLDTHISWDFGEDGTVTDRDSCYAKTEVWYEHTNSTGGVVDAYEHFFGTNFNTLYNGPAHLRSGSIPVEAEINCVGNFTYSQRALYPTFADHYEIMTFMSFSEQYTDGTVVHLNEAATLLDTDEDIAPYDNCNFDSFPKTTEILVGPTKYSHVVYDKNDGDCQTTITDYSNERTYQVWQKSLP